MPRDDHNIVFMTISPSGQSTITRLIAYSVIEKCPHSILIPDHYREDNTCKCDDPNEAVMKEWGYEWKDGLWR
jgi:hypothetical protein